MHAVRVGMALADEITNVHVVHVLHHLSPGLEAYYWEIPRDDERIAGAKKAIEEKLTLADIRGVQVDVLVGRPRD